MDEIDNCHLRVAGEAVQDETRIYVLRLARFGCEPFELKQDGYYGKGG